MDEITVFAPATVSNVVCGFDCLGFALEGPFDRMTLRSRSEPGIKITHLDDFGLTTDPTKNVAGVALTAFMEAAGMNTGFHLEIAKSIKPGSGIGSSAASACGAVVAANALTRRHFSNDELIEIAMAGEMIASGSRHADNLAPCIYGGFTLVRSTTPLDIVSLRFPELYATVVHPQIEIRTSEARAMLPKEVPLHDAIAYWSNLGAFVAGLADGDIDLLSRSMVDTIIEPVRSSLIPHFEEVRSRSLDAGAFGGGISGSGPSMFMLSRDQQTAEAVKGAIASVFGNSNVEFNIYISKVAKAGVRLADQNRY